MEREGQWTSVVAAATTGNHYQQWSDEFAEWDVMALLPGIQANTLVFSAPGIRFAPHAAAQEIAEGIPNARLIIAEGRWPWWPNHESYARAIEAFVLGEDDERDDAFPAGLRTLLFTDLESSTALTQSLGDASK